MKDLLDLIVSNIVSDKDSLSITEDKSEDMIKFTIAANKDDIGKIIGKGGKTIQAIRTILKTFASQEHQWITIDVIEVSS